MAVSDRRRSTSVRTDRLAELTAVYSRWNGAVPENIDPRFRPARNTRTTAGHARDPAGRQTSLRRHPECTKSNAGSRYEPYHKEP